MAEYSNISTSYELRKAILNKIKAINAAREREMKKEVPFFCLKVAENFPELNNDSKDYERLHYKISNLSFDIAICKEKERIIDIDFESNKTSLLDMRENNIISEDDFKDRNKKLKAKNQYDALTNDVEYYRKQIDYILSKNRINEIEDFILNFLKVKYMSMPKDKLTAPMKKFFTELLKALSGKNGQHKPEDVSELQAKLAICEESLTQAKNYYDKLFEKERIKEEKIKRANEVFKGSCINLTPFKDPTIDAESATLLDYRNIEELIREREVVLRLFDEFISENNINPTADPTYSNNLRAWVQVAYDDLIEKCPLGNAKGKKSTLKR